VRFQEGDALHPQANVDKMHDGVPLTDVDRLPWLDSIAALIDRWNSEGVSGIITCSALKRAYRDRAVCVVNSFRSELAQKKAIFDLLTDETLTAGFQARS